MATFIGSGLLQRVATGPPWQSSVRQAAAHRRTQMQSKSHAHQLLQVCPKVRRCYCRKRRFMRRSALSGRQCLYASEHCECLVRTDDDGIANFSVDRRIAAAYMLWLTEQLIAQCTVGTKSSAWNAVQSPLSRTSKSTTPPTNSITTLRPCRGYPERSRHNSAVYHCSSVTTQYSRSCF